MTMMNFSVLEIGRHLPDTGDVQAVHDMVDVAVAADALGFHRIWVAEHHAAPRSACSFPAVLIGHIAARTTRIRVGSGGIMLPNHAPFTVAEQFATLEALHPGRVDLGLGRNPGGTGVTGTLLEAALRREPGAGNKFPEQIDELLGFLHHRGPDKNRFHSLPLTPRTPTPPEVVILGAGEGTARIAAERGLPFTYGHHLGSSNARPEAVDRYRSAFKLGPDGAKPHVIVSVAVICAETDEQAEALAVETALDMVRYPEGVARDAPLAPAREQYLVRKALEFFQLVYGSPRTVAAELERLGDELGADEIMVVPMELAGPGRCRTLRLLAEAVLPTREAVLS
ncbi:MAG TPA: MsnO8 family LLM class oxidoreductase [Actinospica sp.]|jgi:luciferase family oxidoreductase group 1|nr:MsnO8 family LLM class oxidoreductase [Actinospica sp.]